MIETFDKASAQENEGQVSGRVDHPKRRAATDGAECPGRCSETGAGYIVSSAPHVTSQQRKIGRVVWQTCAHTRKVPCAVAHFASAILNRVVEQRPRQQPVSAIGSATSQSAIDAGQQQEDFCPLLVASDRLRLAKIDLIASMAGVTNINGDLADLMSPADYDRVIEFTLNLLAPFVTNPLMQKT